MSLIIYRGNIGTLWNSDLVGTGALTDSISRNFMNLNTQNMVLKNGLFDYASNSIAHLNFYHLNNYNIDKKFKSYGAGGETTFFIGKKVFFELGEVTYLDESFVGNFPEYISFSRELSRNERYRVESYLALKYGLTLNHSYLSSRNISFWNESNNNIFPNRIFGVGKDTISGLNQLQSESVHLKEHLVVAVEEILSTNAEKQDEVSISNNHYLVFGDNGGGTTFSSTNDKGLIFWNKVWLAQVIGTESPTYSMSFKLYVTSQILSYLAAHGDSRLWLIQDNYMDNQSISDFNNESIVYTEATSVDFVEGIAYFDNVFFDADKNLYDQFTFGVGPEIILEYVQDCSGNYTTLKINGGTGPYSILIQPGSGQPYTVQTSNSEYVIHTVPGVTYLVEVTDVNNATSEIEFSPVNAEFAVDLGPDQSLSASETSIVLDADQSSVDPDATYQWWFDGNLMSEYGSSITVTEPGFYAVKVISKDGGCQEKDEIEITFASFEADISVSNGCEDDYNSIVITITGGTAPFVTSLTGTNGTVNYVHSGNTIITDVDFGNYSVEITDASYVVYQGNITVQAASNDLFGNGADLRDQLYALCNACISSTDAYTSSDLPTIVPISSTTITIDATISGSSELTYEWFVNGVPLGVYSPELTFYPGDCNTLGGATSPVYMVLAKNPVTGCEDSRSFKVKGICTEEVPYAKENSSEEPTVRGVVLNTAVYPNPSTIGRTFYYKVFSEESFTGIVQLYSVSGAIIATVPVNGNSSYTLPFNLISSGMYLIKITTSNGTKIDRIIIK